MFYIDHLHIPSFPIALVKTESGFIVRSAETGLGRWTLVVAVISIDVYPFLAFSNMTCHLEVFSGCTVPPDSKETERGNSNKVPSPSAGKNIRVNLVPGSAHESASLQLLPVVWIFHWIKLSWHSCCVRQTWMAQLILAISLWEVIFL